MRTANKKRLYCSGCKATSTFIKSDRGYCCAGDRATNREGCGKSLKPVEGVLTNPKSKI